MTLFGSDDQILSAWNSEDSKLGTQNRLRVMRWLFLVSGEPFAQLQTGQSICCWEGFN